MLRMAAILFIAFAFTLGSAGGSMADAPSGIVELSIEQLMAENTGTISGPHFIAG